MGGRAAHWEKTDLGVAAHPSSRTNVYKEGPVETDSELAHLLGRAVVVEPHSSCGIQGFFRMMSWDSVAQYPLF